jgi:hypothetical protein
MLLVGYLWNDTNVQTYVIRKADGIWRASITNKLNRCRELLSRCSCWSFYSTRRVPRRCPRAVFKRSKYQSVRDFHITFWTCTYVKIAADSCLCCYECIRTIYYSRVSSQAEDGADDLQIWGWLYRTRIPGQPTSGGTSACFMYGQKLSVSRSGLFNVDYHWLRFWEGSRAVANRKVQATKGKQTPVIRPKPLQSEQWFNTC